MQHALGIANDPELVSSPTGLFIGGAWVRASGDATFEVEDPAKEEPLAQVADAGVDDGRQAVQAAVTSFGVWRETSPRARAEILRRAYELVMAAQPRLSRLITMEMGKPVAESRAEVAYAAGFLRWYAEEAVRADGRFVSSEDGRTRVLTLRQPVGPCLFVTPWNFPLAMGARKIAPALAAGCTCVVKSAAQTPLTMLAFAELLTEAGVPAGVVNVVQTSDSARVVAAMLDEPGLRKLSFTGSTEVGRQLLAQASKHILRTSMELGGNAPFIVFEDADIDLSVNAAMVAKMRNGGEACTAANRFYVHAAVIDQFSEALTRRMSSLRLGHGLHEATQMGPLIDGRQRLRVESLLARAVTAGARVHAGQEPLPRKGYFVRPTVITAVDLASNLVDDEIFGPVAPVIAFTSESEVLAAANDNIHGLASYVFTNDFGRAHRVIEQIEAGMVAVNEGVVSNVGAPFGGIKQSGLGREGGPEGLSEYLDVKYAAIAATRR